MTLLEPRKNYGLCDRNFTVKPYCNQTEALLNPNHRFCDVCGKSWLLKDGMVVETTRTAYKPEDLVEGSVWFFPPDNLVTVSRVEGESVEYRSGKGVASTSSVKVFQSIFHPVILH